MKNRIIIILGLMLLLFSCNNKEVYEQKRADQKKQETDSINAARTKYNESISVIRDKNLYADLSGMHSFTMTSDGISTLKGSVQFKKTGRDEYKISGKAKSGKNMITITGTAELVRPQYLNFEGEIIQNTSENHKSFTRKGKKTFSAKGKDQFWRLQDMINGEGFVDYIDIHFK